jgi:hypothetical protein
MSHEEMDMAVKRAKPAIPAAPAKANKPAKAPAHGVKKARNPRLTALEREVFEVVRAASVSGDYEPLKQVDRDTLDTLFRKGVIRLPKILRPAARGTVPLAAIKKAVLAARRERERAKIELEG